MFSIKKQRLRAIFSDIDGTIVHYDAKLKKQGYELVEILEHDNNNNSSSYDSRIHIWKHVSTGITVPALTVPSATLGGGFISVATLQFVKKLRQEHGVKFCLLTGARTSTFLTRAASGSLPEFDFGVCEGGGKIYRPSSRSEKLNENENQKNMNMNLELDEDWINSFSKSIGDWKENRKKFPDHPEKRQGPLWTLYNRLKTEKDLLLSKTSEVNEQNVSEGGFPKLDATSFDSAFMVDLRQLHQPNQSNQQQQDEKPKLLVCGVEEVSELEGGLKAVISNSDEFKDLLTVFVNLGKGHVTAKGCTKADVVEYLANKKIEPKLKLFSEDDKKADTNDDEDDSEIVAGMFDDENDLDFVRLCHVGFAPGIAHPSVENFLKAHREELKDKTRYRKCNIEGFLGTEEALKTLLEKYC